MKKRLTNQKWGNFEFGFEVKLSGGEHLPDNCIIYCSARYEDKWDFSFDQLVLEQFVTTTISESCSFDLIRPNPYLDKMVKNIILNSPSDKRLENLSEDEFEIEVISVKYGKFDDGFEFCKEYWDLFVPHIMELNYEREGAS